MNRTDPVAGRTLALAGLMQATTAVRRIALDGSAEVKLLEPCLASIFRLDADTPLEIYGSVAEIGPGLRTLIVQLDGSGGRDPFTSRMSVTVLHVERKLIRQPDMLASIRRGVQDAERQRQHFGLMHPNVIAGLGEVYANTVSQLRPRVLVQGNPMHLSQSAVVGQIRATLLAAVRSAVLWRQLGGSYWDLVLRRKQMNQAARNWLEHA